MKNLKPTLALIALGLFLGQETHAQDAVVKNSNAVPVSFESADIKITAAGSEVVTSPDSRMTSKLSAAFPDAKAQEWRKMNHCYYVSFLNKNRKARAMFSDKGAMNYAITDCSLDQLPEAFRAKIAKQYAGYKVVSATEINAYDAIAFQAILEDSHGYVTLRSNNEGIEEIDTTRKDK